MFRIGALASDLLNNIDNAAKETLEEPKMSATSIRNALRKVGNSSDDIVLTETANNNEHRISSSELYSPDKNEVASPTESNKYVDIDLKTKLRKKNEEIEKLNGECLDLEKQCESLQREVKEAWEAFHSAQQKHASRESELISEIEGMKNEWMSEKTQLLDTVLVSQNQLDRLQYLENMAEEWTELRQKLEADLGEALQHSVRGAAGLVEELSQAKSVTESLRSAHLQAMQQAHLRQGELEAAVQELTVSVTEKQRMCDKLQSRGQEGAERVRAIEAEGEERRLQAEALEGQLQELRDSSGKRIRVLEMDLQSGRKAWEEERAMLLERCAANAAAREVAPSHGQPLSPSSHETGGGPSAASAAAVVAEMEDQLRALGQQLLRKQESVQELLSERAGLKVRLLDTQKRLVHLEQQLSSAPPDSGRDVEGGDVEGGHRSSGLLHRRGGFDARSPSPSPGSSHERMISDLERFGVKAGPGVARAVSAIDAWTLVTGRFLRNYPLLRLGFVLYLFLIHLWALFLLAMHTHSLDIDNEAPLSSLHI